MQTWLSRLRLNGDARVVGVDAARALALLGMMATHVFDQFTDTDEVSFAYMVASGKASALFCVLAGLSLSLTTGHGRKVTLGTRLGVAVRGVLLILLGFWLTSEGQTEGIAIILANYGALFLFGSLLLTMPRWALFSLAGVWAVAGPVGSWLIRGAGATSGAYEPSYVQPSFETELSLAQTVQEILLTGYYPLVTWMPFFLLGMAVGRLRLKGVLPGVVLAASGVVLFAVSQLMWAMFQGHSSFAEFERMAMDTFDATDLDPAASGFYGITPTWHWGFLLYPAPHSGSLADVFQMCGTSLFVIGACLVIFAGGKGFGWVKWALYPLVAAGSMTLTLYVTHVYVYEEFSYTQQVVGALVFATLWSLTTLRGPLETIMSYASSAPVRLERLLTRPAPDTEATAAEGAPRDVDATSGEATPEKAGS